MGSVGSPEEEVNLNTTLTAPHIIPYSSSSPPFLAQVSNQAPLVILVIENYGIGAKKDVSTETALWDKGGKYPYSDVGWIRIHLILKFLR